MFLEMERCIQERGGSLKDQVCQNQRLVTWRNLSIVESSKIFQRRKKKIFFSLELPFFVIFVNLYY